MRSDDFDGFADAERIVAAGLRVPPLLTALHEVPGHPELRGLIRLTELPGVMA